MGGCAADAGQQHGRAAVREEAAAVGCDATRLECGEEPGKMHRLPASNAGAAQAWDMGSVRHRKTDWSTATTCGDVVDSCVNKIKNNTLTVKHVVVFDRHDLGPQTKEDTQSP